MLAALCGGVGAARMLAGMCAVVAPEDLVGIVNTGDDCELHGLTICPDLDTVTYTLAGRNNTELGWGLAGESWRTMDRLAELGGPTWFRLGDLDLATHLYRTGRLRAGASLDQVVTELARANGVAVQLLPVTNDPLRTRVTIADSGEEIDFQEYFVARRHGVAISAVRFVGAEQAQPAPGVLDALGRAEQIVVCPSNPIVSLGPLLAVPGIRAAVEARRANAVAVSPIVAGAALKGPADRMLAELGHEASVVGVARLLAPLVATLVIDEADRDAAPAVEALGLRCVVTDTIMATPERAAALAEVVLGAGR